MSLHNLTLCVPKASSGQDPLIPTLVESQVPIMLPENHVLLRVDKFGFSANNITYQALGEAPHFRYFEFHAVPEAHGVSAETHGIIPVWGFATVVRSSYPGIECGERVYGYLSPSRYLLLAVSPSNINRYSFSVPRPHLPSDRRPYNQITRCSADPQYDPSSLAEDLTMLYRPLFWTAFWFQDWLEASGYRGTKRIVISSASAKTAFCLAYLSRMYADDNGIKGFEVVGLTSSRNLAFTRGLGLYTDVIGYDDFDRASALDFQAHRWIYVDIAGNENLNARIRHCFASSTSLVAWIQLGLTNLSPSAPSAPSTKFSTNTTLEFSPQTSNGIVVEQFFMPEWLAVRRKQLSISEVTKMQAKAWRKLMRDGKGWVRMEKSLGAEEVLRAYCAISRGGITPQIGMVWSLWENTALERDTRSKL